MLPDTELKEIVELNISKLRNGGFVVDTKRAERLAMGFPNGENILDTLYNAIEGYQNSKGFTLAGLPDRFSLQKCSAAFDKAILSAVLS